MLQSISLTSPYLQKANLNVPNQQVKFKNNVHSNPSFSGKLPKNLTSRAKIKLQRKLFNKFERFTTWGTQKIFGFLNKLDRERRFPNFDYVKKYCDLTDCKLISPVTLFSKKEKEEVTGYAVIRKLNLFKKYKGVPFLCESGDFLNTLVDEKIKATRKGPDLLSKMFGLPKNHLDVTSNSFEVHILDNCGLPVGKHYIDITPEGIISKGVVNLEPDNYGRVGTILNDIKSLTAEINGSIKVTMPTTDKAKPFHQKCGYTEDENKLECGVGEWLQLPPSSLDKIVNRYKNTELYLGLRRVLGEFGLAKQ